MACERMSLCASAAASERKGSNASILRNNSGGLAILLAMRLASSFVSNFAEALPNYANRC
jgi:hypothetical protein